MQIHYKEKALLANQYKIEKAERTKNWIGRNVLKVVLFGVFISFVGPGHVAEADGIDRKETVMALDLSDFDYMGTVLYVAIWYAVCMLIAYFVFKYQDNKKIACLKDERIQLEAKLKHLRSLE